MNQYPNDTEVTMHAFVNKNTGIDTDWQDAMLREMCIRDRFYYSQAEKLLGNFDVSIKNLYDALEYATPTNTELNGQILSLIHI